MAKITLEERFLKKMDELYGKYSIRDLPDGMPGHVPYMETKPNQTNKRNFGESRTTPLHSIAADTTRMSRFSTDKPLWYLDQQNLQSGNTFGETRVLNPLFVLGNVQPFLHIKRPYQMPQV